MILFVSRFTKQTPVRHYVFVVVSFISLIVVALSPAGRLALHLVVILMQLAALDNNCPADN